MKVPIAVWCDGATPVRAHTVVVNLHGALILSPHAFGAGAVLSVLNQENGQTVVCRVAWCGGEDLPGLYKLGIEIVGEAPHFWDDQNSVVGLGGDAVVPELRPS